MAPLDIMVDRTAHKSSPAHHITSRSQGLVVSGPRYQNPWNSWHKPTKTEVWDALQWGEDQDPCIALAATHIKSPRKEISTKELSMRRKAEALLSKVAPNFDFDPASGVARVTWVGHAGVLLQLRPLEEGGRPVRCLFDPIFSLRCSPSQTTGPIRTYTAPCAVSDLPPIDLVMLSHDHYDHCDNETIRSLWRHHQEHVRFIVPLGCAQWYFACGVPSNRITELDWWDSATLSTSQSQSQSHSLTVRCTPSQHNSGGGVHANETLWASWYVKDNSETPYSAFFAGDTGFQFHDGPHWPPAPSPNTAKKAKLDVADAVNGKWPCCPAFKEIADTLGSPDLLLLPVAVGATFDYIRSWMPLPDSLSPFPRHTPGVTAANHMPPWDAVRVLRIMTDGRSATARPPVAIAMHWGTFVPNPSEVLKTLGNLEWACNQHGVEFARDFSDTIGDKTCFLALNHGQSVSV